MLTKSPGLVWRWLLGAQRPSEAPGSPPPLPDRCHSWAEPPLPLPHPFQGEGCGEKKRSEVIKFLQAEWFALTQHFQAVG